MEEKRITVSIGYDVQDTYFKFPQQVMSDIVDALHKNERVLIHLTEGIALEELNYKEKKFLEILKELCDKNNWPLAKIHFLLPNLVQDKSVWPSIEYGGASLLIDTDLTRNIFLGLQVEKIQVQKDIQKTFGIFVHRSQWDRLLLSSHLHKNHKEITMQTFRKSLTNPADMVEIGLDQLFWLLSSDNKLDPTIIEQVTKFISSIPHNNGMDWQYTDQQATVDKNIISCYNNIFVDVVCEKMVTGQTFFPTEKTGRPLATKTPFIIMSAPNYLKNLRRLGFKTFQKFWNENYDYQQGVQRIESMKDIIDDLAKMDTEDLNVIYRDMLPILEHNHRTYQELTDSKILKAFDLR